MIIVVVDWFYFQRPWVGLNWYSFRFFGFERLLNNDLITLSVRWMTHTALRHCMSLLSLHHKCASAQRVKVDDATSSHILPHQTYCISLPSSEFYLTHLCSLFQKVLFRTWSLYKYRRYFILIQKFHVRNSTLMQWKYVKQNCHETLNCIPVLGLNVGLLFR